MAQLLTKFKEFFILKEKSISIDSWSFQMFNIYSTAIFMFCSIVVTARQFFGEPIRCDAGSVSPDLRANVQAVTLLLGLE